MNRLVASQSSRGLLGQPCSTIARGDWLPAFSVRLDPPPADDGAWAEQLAADSARRYGRPRDLVDAGRQTALARIAALHQRVVEQAQAARAAEEPPPPPGDAGRRARNQRRAGGQP